MRKESYIYGINSKNGECVHIIRFEILDDAQDWIYMVEYDIRHPELRVRELCTREVAMERVDSRLIESLDYFC